MSHIVLINSERDQVESHKVDADTFLKVYDLLHPSRDIKTDLSFGAASRVGEISEGMRAAVANSEPMEPVADVQPTPRGVEKPVSDDTAFAASLAALLAG